MQEEYSKNIESQIIDHGVGSKVSIKVPKEDHRKRNPLRVPGEVIEIKGVKRKTNKIRTGADILEK